MTAEPPRPGTKAYITIQRDEARARVRVLESLPNGVAAAEAMRADLGYLADHLFREAVRRGWCGEYETFVRFINKRMKHPWLQVRTSQPGDCMCVACIESRRAADLILGAPCALCGARH